MLRTPLVLALAISLSTLAACSDIAAPHRSGSDDGQRVGDLRGKGNDPQPHPDLVSFSRQAQPGDVQSETEARHEAEARREAETRREAQNRREAEVRREPEQRNEAQPGDDRRGRGKDDPANHG